MTRTATKRAREKSSDAATAAAVPPLPDDVQDRLDAGLAGRREWLANIEAEAKHQAPLLAEREEIISAAEITLRERSNARMKAALPEIWETLNRRIKEENKRRTRAKDNRLPMLLEIDPATVDLFAVATGEISVDDPRHKLLLEESQRRRDERDAWFPSTPISGAWEGIEPTGPIRTLAELRAGAADELGTLQYLSQGGVFSIPAFEVACAAIRNIYRTLDILQVRDRPACPAEPANATDAERQLSNLVTWFDQRGADQPASEPAATNAVGKSSSNDLALKHGIDPEKLRKRLERWRHNHDSGYVEATTRRPHDPTFLYDEAAILPVINALKTSGQRPAKKI